ncbi:MAG: hypothetical protein R8M11_03445 [Gallionella sp.]
MLHRLYYLTLASFILVTSACSTNIRNPDATSPAKSHIVPQYSLGLIQFTDKTTSKPHGTGNSATKILSSKLEDSGLRVTTLSTNNLDNIEFQLSGVITGYSEVEESIDTIVFQQQTSVARVSLKFTLSDIVSGKPILSESVTGEYRKITSDSARSGIKDHRDPALIDGALNEALGKVTEEIVQVLSTMPFQGKIIDVTNQSVILKAGTRSHLEVDTELDVFHIGEAILDLSSGKIAGYLENKVGSIQITKHRNGNLSEASIISGSSIKAGDIVRQEP